MSIILAEPAYPGEPSERTRQLVPVQRPEVGPPQGEFPPRAKPLLEHETEQQKGRKSEILLSAISCRGLGAAQSVSVHVPVGWAVHWFESIRLGALRRHCEHVLAVVLPVP